MKFVLVRHGQTDYNTAGRYGGHTDVPLNGTGRAQARAVAEKLKTMTFDKVYCSDLSRAKDTADAINVHHDHTLHMEPNLREMFFGAWEGLTYREILKRDPELGQLWSADNRHVPCPDGESLQTFYDRVMACLTDIRHRTKPDETVLLVAHSGVLRAILTGSLVGSIEGFWKFKIDNGAVTVLEFDGDFAMLHALNA